MLEQREAPIAGPKPAIGVASASNSPRRLGRRPPQAPVVSWYQDITPKNFTVRLRDEEAANAEALARAEGVSLNETVRRALAEAVERRRADPASRPESVGSSRRIRSCSSASLGDRLLAGARRLPDHRDGGDWPRRRYGHRGHEDRSRRFGTPRHRLGWGQSDLYPDFVDKAAVLLTRLTKNHPLPDGNKRAAWVALRVFIELNDWEWAPHPSVNEAERVMLDVVGGTWSEREVAEWLGPRNRTARLSGDRGRGQVLGRPHIGGHARNAGATAARATCNGGAPPQLARGSGHPHASVSALELRRAPEARTSRYIDGVDAIVLARARRHGVADQDILHGYRNPVRVLQFDDLTMLIGADEAGRMLEIRMATAEGIEFIVHAMPAREKFLR